jgi:hypothetical protein
MPPPRASMTHAVALLSLAVASCAPEPTPTVAPTPAATMEPAPTAAPSASAKASAAPTVTAQAAAPPAPHRETAAEIIASLPEKAGTVTSPSGIKVTVSKSGRVQIEDPHGHLAGTSSCGANGFDYRKAVTLFAELRDALHAGDRAKVATLMLYPLRLNVAVGKHLTVKDPESLKEDFDKAFTEPVLKAIEKAEPRAVFCKAEGFMLGSGVVWAEKKRGRYGVFVINL